MGNHLIKSTSLEELRALSLVSATFEIECPTHQSSHTLSFRAVGHFDVAQYSSLPCHLPCPDTRRGPDDALVSQTSNEGTFPLSFVSISLKDG